MEIVKLSPKFQIVIPKKVREGLALTAGQELQLYVLDGTIRIHPPRNMRDLAGIAKGIEWKATYRDRDDRF
jgi:AbrB family looped-hinge helix DNA binding protein